jgi:hypothetical protein
MKLRWMGHPNVFDTTQTAKTDSFASLRNDKQEIGVSGLHPTHRDEAAMDGAPG